MQTTIEQIREKRKKLKLSQWGLAVLVNRSGPWLGLREAGYVEANQAELETLSAALKEAECQAGQVECQTAGVVQSYKVEKERLSDGS